MKEIAAKEIAKRVKNGETIGVGTGSTVDIAINLIGQRVKEEGLKIKVVPTSYQSAWRCQELGLDVLSPAYNAEISWGFDGADEVNDKLWLIKGRGGAMLQEKLVAARCREFIAIVDDSKVVSKLGEKCPVPVEVIPDALFLAKRALGRLGAVEITERQGSGKHGPTITERGNIILDVKFKEIYESLERDIKSQIGIVESGLFIGLTKEVIVASAGGIKSLR